MTNYEMVEIIRKGASVTVEEAKEALEQSNWDLLDAMLLLEKQGKVGPGGGSYSTRPEEEKPEPKSRARGENTRGALHWLWQTFLKLLRIGNSNSLVVSRKGEEIFSLPVTVVALLLIPGFWLVVIGLVAGLFFGVRYSFRGPNLGKASINSAMDRAAQAAENVKEELRTHEKPGSAK